jgi:hypothetical protein
MAAMVAEACVAKKILAALGLSTAILENIVPQITGLTSDKIVSVP